MKILINDYNSLSSMIQAAPGIESRFANELPPPSGGQYGVFASSHSSSATDGSGKTIAHKSATTGVNDNGKITFRTVQDK